MPRPARNTAGTQDGGRLRVAWIGGPLPPETGHLTLLGREVDLMVVCSDGPAHDNPVPAVPAVQVNAVRAYGARGTFLRWVYPSLGKALDAFQPDLVHVVNEPWGLLSVHASLWARRHPSVALVLHGCDRIWWHGGRLEKVAKHVLARTSLRAASGFCAETLAAGDIAAGAGLPPGAPRAQIHTNPRDPEVFRPPETDAARAAGRRRLGLPEDGVGVAFIGRLVPEKGPLLLLDAWQALPEQVRAGAWLALAGDGPLRDAVRARAALVPGAHFLGTIAFPDGVADLCRGAQVVAVPSYTVDDWDDQSPRTVIEGLLCGTVVVGSRSGGIPVMLGGAGILVAERDLKDLTRGLAEALALTRDAASLARARDAAVEQGRREYSTASVAAQLLELWPRCVSR